MVKKGRRYLKLRQVKVPAGASGTVPWLSLVRTTAPVPMTAPTRATKVETPDQAFKLVSHLWRSEVEHFLAIHLDVAKNVLGLSLVGTGGTEGTIADPRVVFRTAIAAGASAVIVAHNHPSGAKEWSADDLALTARMTQAGHFLGIEMLDHILVCGPRRYLSYAFDTRSV